MLNSSVLLRDGGFNFVFLLGLTFLLCLVLPRLRRLTQPSYSVTLGLAFGALAVGTMLVPFTIAEGVGSDLSTVAVVAAGVFAGPWGTIAAAIVTGVYGVVFDGLAGGDLVCLAAAAGLGGAFHMFQRRRGRAVGSLHYLAFGLALAILATALAAVPAGLSDWHGLERAFDAAPLILPVALVIYPLAALTVCQLISREIRRIDEQRTHAAVVERLSERETVIRVHETEAGEHKRTEKALRESEALLQRVQHIAKVGHWVWTPGADRDWRDGTTRFSELVGEIYGVPSAKLPVSNQAFLDDFVHPDDRARAAAAFARLVEPDREAYKLEYRILCPTGEVRTVYEIAENVLGDHGMPLYSLGTLQDISERKATEAALAESQSLLRAVVEAVPATINVRDRNGRYVFVNALHAKYHDRPVEWFPGHSPSDIYDETYVCQINAVDREVMESDKPPGFVEFDYTERSGRTSAWLLSCAPIRNASGEATHIVRVALDITERKAAEAALAESRTLLRAVIDSVPTMIAVRDLEGRYVLINEALAKYHGRPVEWFPGRTPAELYPDGYVQQLRAADRAAIESREHREFEESNVTDRAGRHTTWLASRSTILDRAGAVKYVVAVALDITERKRMEAALRESEGRFRTIADSIPALVWMCDETGECIFLNKQWSDYTGRPIYEELGHGFLESIHPDEREHSRKVEHSILVARTQAVDEYRLLGKNGQYRWFLDTMVPRFSSDGAYLGHLGILIDIEDRRKLEEQLRLVQKLEAVGHLTAGIAHDFNNLLTVIIGNLDLIRDKPEDAKHVMQLAGFAFQSAQRGAELVRRMIAFSRQQMLKPHKIDLNRLVAGMIDLLRRTLSANIEIVARPAEGLWTALADPGQVEEALLNLSINSRDAMPEGGRLVIETGNTTLDAQYAASDSEVTAGDYVVLTVSDTGAGMTQEVAAHAVQPFFTTKEVGKGSGLGLSMVYGFAKQSGGHMKIYSEPGHGCAVRLYLPRFLGAAESAADAPRTGPARGSETILVVEDDERVRHYVVDQLRTLGYDILEASDGPAALALIASGGRIDLLFTDIMLPGGLLGPQLLDQVRAHLPGLRALFTSGYSEATLLPRQRLDGEIPLLEKPYSRQDLALKIRSALDAARP